MAILIAFLAFMGGFFVGLSVRIDGDDSLGWLTPIIAICGLLLGLVAVGIAGDIFVSSFR